MKPKISYIWFIPLMWILVSMVLYFYPGDEYGCFYFGTLPASLICFFYDFGSMTKNLLAILPIGTIIFTGTGFCLDRLKANKKIFFVILALTTIALFCYGVVDLGSLDRVQRKYSIPGFAGLSLNIALFFTIMISLAVYGFTRLWQLTHHSKRLTNADTRA